jgi:aerobic carbon-monoxide dehydrogenase small subunit
MTIRLTLNGKETELNVPPNKKLSHVLRDDCGLRGVHPGCGRGQCGGCLVLDGKNPVYSCLIPAFMANGKNITTIEGFVQTPLFGIIERGFKRAGVILCDFCAPARVLSLGALILQGRNPDTAEILDQIDIVRCPCIGPESLETGIQIALEEHYARERR